MGEEETKKKEKSNKNRIKYLLLGSFLVILFAILAFEVKNIVIGQYKELKISSNELLTLFASFFAISLLLFEIYRIMVMKETKKFFIVRKEQINRYQFFLKIFLFLALFFSFMTFSIFYGVIIAFFEDSVLLYLIFRYFYLAIGILLVIFSVLILIPKSLKS